jgi:hypothetical protein
MGKWWNYQNLKMCLACEKIILINDLEVMEDPYISYRNLDPFCL